MKYKIVKKKETLALRSNNVRTSEIEDLSNLLTRELTKRLGRPHYAVGLAAIQLGIDKRAFAMILESGEPLVFINPEIIERKEMYVWLETCLSIKKSYYVERYKYITIRNGLDKKEYKFKDLSAAICQHEVDHLNGLTIKTKVMRTSITTIKGKESKDG